MDVILGSSSKWRRQLAKQYLGVETELMAPDIDEREVAKAAAPGDPSDHPLVIARAKLAHLLQRVRGRRALILCFDTVVCCGGEIMEKPESAEECVAMVRKWAKGGTVIDVYTGVAVGHTEPRVERSECHRAGIRMTRDLSDKEVEEYIAKSNCIVSSGAVVVEDLIEMGAAEVDGDQSVIEGLPIEACRRLMGEIGELVKQ